MCVMTTHSQQVSTEGFFDSLKATFNVLIGKPAYPEAKVEPKADEDPKRLDFDQQLKLMDLLKNATELRKMPLVQGTVSGKRISSRLLGRDTDAQQVLRRLGPHMALIERVCRESVKGTDRIAKWMHDSGLAIAQMDETQAWRHLQQSAKREKLFPYKLSQSDNNSILGPDPIKFDHLGDPFMGESNEETLETLPALTLQQILNFAKILPTIVRRLEEQEIAFPDVLCGPYEGDRAPMLKTVEVAMDANDHDLLNLFHRKYFQYGWLGSLWTLHGQLENAVEAIEMWINASIQWDQVSNEMVDDSHTKLQLHFNAALESCDLSVSQEGLIGDIFGAIRGIFKYRPADHEKLTDKAVNVENNRVLSQSRVRKLMMKCFLNDRWLDSHELVSGEISSYGIANRLAFGDKFNSVNPIDQVVVDARELQAQNDSVGAAMDKNQRWLLEQHNRMLRLVGPGLPHPQALLQLAQNNITDYSRLVPRSVHETLAQVIEDTERNSTYALLSGENFYASESKVMPRFGGMVCRKGNIRPSNVKLPSQLPALNRQQIKAAAAIVLRWIESDSLNPLNRWAEEGTGVDDGTEVLEKIFSSVLRAEAYGHVDMTRWTTNEIFWACMHNTREGKRWSSLVGHENFLKSWTPTDGRHENLQVAMIGLVEWMGRSIHGRLASVST